MTGSAVFPWNALRSLAKKPKEYGCLLYGCLFKDEPLRRYFENSLAIAQSNGKPYRLRLRIDTSEARLHMLFWEMLCHTNTGQFVTQNANLRFCRVPYKVDWSNIQLPERGELRALVAIASPAELKDTTILGTERYNPLDVAGELERAQRALGRDVHITALTSRTDQPGEVTFDRLKAALGQGCDIFYLVCHGALLPDDPLDPEGPATPHLLLEQPDGRKDLRKGSELVQFIQNLEIAARPRLVVLASCQSAGSGYAPGAPDEQPNLPGAWAAIGPALGEAGIPAVLAMQSRILIRTVDLFMPVFFEEILKDGKLERALALARSGIAPNCPDWWVPVLYNRLTDDCLFTTENSQVKNTDKPEIKTNKDTPDAFFSFCEDAHLVKHLARKLQNDHGLNIWLDKWI